jgi:hypothetical protein
MWYAVALIVGIWIGYRWSRVKMQARCDARNCDTIVSMRTAAMKMSADKMSVERQFDFMRSELRRKDLEIHGLKSTKGKLGQELQRLAFFHSKEA